LIPGGPLVGEETERPRGAEEHGVTEGRGSTTPELARVLVGVTGAPGSDRLLDAAVALAAARGGGFVAVTVRAVLVDADDPGRAAALDVLRRAAALGGETEVLHGDEAAALVEAARRHGAGLLVVGAPGPRAGRRRLLDRILELAGDDLDVHVVAPRPGTARPVRPAPRPVSAAWSTAVAGPLTVAIAAGLAWLLRPWLEPGDVAMLFLLAVTVVAFRVPRWAAIGTALVAVATLDFLFVPPTFTLHVLQPRYVLTFAVLGVVGVVVSDLAARNRARAAVALAGERRTATLYALTAALAHPEAPDDPETLAAVAARFLQRQFGRAVRLELGPTSAPDEADETWLPLVGSRGALGRLGIRDGARLDPDTRHLLETCAAQIAVALDRLVLHRAAREAAVAADTERLRSSLLSSVSHDLRTPLAAIQGAATSLLDETAALPAAARRMLLEDVVAEAERLSTLLTNLLELTRLGGGLTLRGDWHLVEDVLSSALGRVARPLAGRDVRVVDHAAGRLVLMDPLLVELALVNLLENAARHAPDGPVDVAAEVVGGGVQVEVADRGPGLPPGDRDRVFERFWRAPGAHGGGAGLGLAICDAVARLHGGRVAALDRDGGGAVFRLWLPLGGPEGLAAPDATEGTDA
jgi:two-component system sensor histidine kinase KdpD